MCIYLLLIILSTISFTSGSTQVDIKDAGVGYINEGDIAMLFYITLENKCNQNFEIWAGMIQCCDSTKETETDCTSMYLIGGDMGLLSSSSIKNITLIYPNLYIYNRHGTCTVDVRYQNEHISKEITAEIEFNTVKKSCLDSLTCSTPDLDPMHHCLPVDCVIKYSGEISYFNTESGQCERVPMCISDPAKCLPEIAYSIDNNTCTGLDTAITKNDLQLLENQCQVPIDTNECEGPLEDNFVCHNGNINPSTGECICHSYWVTTTDDEEYQPTVLQYHMCNVEVGAWNCVNKRKIRTTALLISIFAVTIASKILILMCILNWCYKHFKYRGKICTDKLDPFDESLVLCQDLGSLDQCLCSEPPSMHEKKKTGGLKTETVNVSYYHCCPSGLSSIRASSRSKGKYSTKTDQTAILSETTSSSIPISFETETDALSDDSDEDEDEEEGDYEEGEEEEDEDGKYEDDVKPITAEPSSLVQDEDESDYTISVPESRKFSSSYQSKSASNRSLSSHRHTN